MIDPKDIDWNNLDFSYIKTPYRFISRWKDGKWDQIYIDPTKCLEKNNK